MELSVGMSLSISRSFYNVFIYVIVACCYLCLMNASFPTTAATSILGGNETDRLALLAFKAKIINDPFKVMSSWNGSIHFCQWRGVTCGHRHKRVTKLDLSSQKLFGSISPHIGNLSFLRLVNLQNNSFENEIPPDVGHLRRLQYLALDNNSISGSIPVNLSACNNLLGFEISFNKLVGTIPMELGSLSKLKFLSFRRNIDLIGNIPHSFMNFSSLEVLDASENHLSGSVPEALGQLTKLTNIILGDNMLSGTIPPSIFNLSSLILLDLVNNQFTGRIPSDIGITLPSLVRLGLGINQFTGSIPISISNATNLEDFFIGGNNLNGKVPTMGRLHKLQYVVIGANHLGSGGVGDLSFIYSLTNATNLRWLAMDHLNFGGMLPQSVGNLSTKLEIFDIDYNRIFGSIPVAIGNLINLNWLTMSSNQFTGNIPTELGKLKKLERLGLAANNFSGNIPSSLGNLSVLNVLNGDDNNLQGNVPSSLGKCQNLLALSFSINKLSGTIPQHVFNLSSLSIYLDLAQNHFTGSLPVEVGNLKNLGELYVHENMLSGEIPNTIGSCVSLEHLYMGSNFFQGSIPSSLSNLKGIQELNLSRNNLTGKIPEYFKSFRMLKKLNLSYNDFDGMVPIEGVFGNASAISIMGNSKLCGGIPELQLPRCNLTDSKKRDSTLSFKMVIAIASGLLVVTLVFCTLYVCWCRKKREKHSTEDSGSSFLRVSYQSLYRATNGFSKSNLIGVGSFGTVFEGIIDGKKIAVKVLNLLHRGASRSFITECEALRNIRHRNLVKILSACSSVDFQNNDFKALVYEFMVNGSLDDWLHPIGGQGEVPKDFSLVQRLHIAIDVACALDYLHHHCQTPIVHCDLKPSNVLLDDDMTAHVGDFGISRFLLDANQNISENQTSSIGIRGSVGYMPPEYGMGSGVSTSGDVYSYGILLLEMFTGKRPTDEMFNDGMNLHNYSKMALLEGVVNIADSILLQQEEKGENFHKIQECLVSIFRIGIACSTESPVERLDMSDVVTKLQVNMDNLLGTRHGRRIANPVQS